jgi:Putative phage tail protein
MTEKQVGLIVLERPNPFDPQVRRSEVALVPGQPLALYLPNPEAPVLTFLDGKLVPADVRSSLVPHAGQQLVIAADLGGGGGGGGKGILRMVALLAVMAIAIFAGPIIGVFGYAFISAGWAAAASAAIAIGGSLIVNALLPPPSMNRSQSQNYGWGGAQMTAQQGLPVPIQGGMMRRGFNVIASYTTTTLTQQWLNILLDGGWGPARSMTQILINGNPLSDYPGVWTDSRLGHNEQAPLDHFHDVVNSYPQNERLRSADGGFTVIGTRTDTQAAEFEFSFPKGLWAGPNSDGSYDIWTVHLQVSTRLLGAVDWTSILRPRTTAGLPVNLANQAPYWIAVTTQWSPNASNTAYVLAVSYGERDHRVGQVYRVTEAVPTYDPSGNPTGTHNITLTGSWQINPLGPGSGSAVQAGVNYVVITDYSTVTHTVSWNKTTACWDTVRIDNLPSGQYEYKVEKLGASQHPGDAIRTDTEDTQRRGEETWFTALREITYDTLAYPNKVLLAVRALATDKLSGSSLNITAVVDMGATPAMGYKNEVGYDLPEAYYRMSDTGGACADLTGHGHDGGYVGSPSTVVQGEPGLVVASPDAATHFSSGDSVLVGSPGTPVVLSPSGWAAELWCSPDSPSALAGKLLSNADASVYLALDASGKVNFHYAGDDHLSAVTLDPSRSAHHIAVGSTAAAGFSLATRAALAGPVTCYYWTDSSGLGSGNANDYFWKNPADPATGPAGIPLGLGLYTSGLVARTLASAAGTLEGSSLLVDPAGGNASTTPQWVTFDPNGVQTGSQNLVPVTFLFNVVLMGMLYIPEPGTYTLKAHYKDSILWGIAGASWQNSGSVLGELGQTMTVGGGYPLLPAPGCSASVLLGVPAAPGTSAVDVTFPAAGLYPFEVDWNYATQLGRTLSITCNGVDIVPTQRSAPAAPPFAIPTGQQVAWSMATASSSGHGGSGTINGSATATPNGASLAMTHGSSLGISTWGAAWSGFTTPTLPTGATVEGIYAVIVGNHQVLDPADGNALASAAANPSSAYGIPLGGTPIVSDNAAFSGEFHSATLGTDLSILATATIAIQLEQTLNIAFNDLFTVTGVGFAVYYSGGAVDAGGSAPGGFLFLVDGQPAFDGNLLAPGWTPNTIGGGFAGELDEVALYAYPIQPGRLMQHWLTGTAGIHSSLEDREPSNPAMQVIDRLVNPLYGGQQSPKLLDVTAFTVYADFNDELVPDGMGGQIVRHIFNGVHDKTGSLWEAVGKIGQMSRTVLYRSGTQYTCVCDAPVTRSQLFTMGNIKQDSFKESWPGLMDRANTISGTYLDETKDYKQTPLRVMDEAAIASGDPINDAGSVDLWGITNPRAAWRELTYRLLANKAALPSVQIDCALEGIAARLGDGVGLQHDVPQWGAGGRILAAASVSASAAMAITLDQEVTLASGPSYVLMLVLPAVQRATGTISSSAGNVVVLASAWNGAAPVKRLLVDGLDLEIIAASTSAGVAVLTLAQAAALTPGHACQLWDVDVIESHPVTNAPGATRTVTVAPVFSALPDPYTLYFFGQLSDVQDFRLTAVGRRSDQEMTLQLTKYDPTLYGDLEPVLPVAPVNANQIAVTNLAASEAPNDTPQKPLINVTWTPGMLTAGARVYLTRAGLPEYLAADVRTAFAQVAADGGYTYTVRVVGYNAAGYSAPYASAPTVTITLGAVTQQTSNFVSMTPAVVLSQAANTYAVDMAAFVATFSNGSTASYKARSFPVPNPGSIPVTYYVTIYDPSQTGDDPDTLNAYCDTTSLNANTASYIFAGKIIVTSAGGNTGGPGGPNGINAVLMVVAPPPSSGSAQTIEVDGIAIGTTPLEVDGAAIGDGPVEVDGTVL